VAFPLPPSQADGRPSGNRQFPATGPRHVHNAILHRGEGAGANDGQAHRPTYNDLQLSSEAARLPIQEIVTFLMQLFGKPMTAYIGGVTDPKMVTHWTGGTNTPRALPQMRLREAYQAARLIVDAAGAETAKAWFFCSNAKLADRAPAHVLRTAATWEDMREVLPAARAFVREATRPSLDVA
jgi:hypothetical protein